MSAFTPGMRIHDRFTLEHRIGLGGMSEVWRAVDGVLGRPVAVKVLGSALAEDPVLWQATLREARAVAQITHPNVAQVHDYGELALAGGGHVPYLVMELVQGQDLANRLRLGPLVWQQAAKITAEVAAGLAAAHRLGVVHRDVKPGNIMLTAGGVKILDFGIAALANGPDADRGRLIGTPTYTAPERMQPGAPAPASDVYAVGVLLYEMLTGRPPHAFADWKEALAAHRSGLAVAPIDVPGVPQRLARLAVACLAPDPGRRPSAAEVASVAGAAAAESASTAAATTAVLPAAAPRPSGPAYAGGIARPPSPPTMLSRGTEFGEPEPPRRSTRTIVAMMVIGAVLAVLLGVMLAYSLTSPFDDGNNAAPPSGGAVGSSAPEESATPSEEPSPSPSFDVQGIVSEIDAVIASAEISDGRARDLRKRLNDLRSAINQGREDRIRDRIDGLKNKVEDLADDGDLDQQSADQVKALLDQLEDQLGV